MSTAEARSYDHILDISDGHSVRLIQQILRCSAAGADDADNAAAEAIARSLHRRDVGTPLIPWGRAVARRLVIDEARRHSRFASKAHLLDIGINQPEPDDVAAVVDVRTAIAQLPLREQDALALRYYLDLTVAEVARNMHVSTASARSTLFRARRTLCALLGDQRPC